MRTVKDDEGEGEQLLVIRGAPLACPPLHFQKSSIFNREERSKNQKETYSRSKHHERKERGTIALLYVALSAFCAAGCMTLYEIPQSLTFN